MTQTLLPPPTIVEAGITYRLAEYVWSEPQTANRSLTIVATDADLELVRGALNTRTFTLNKEGFSRRNMQGNPDLRRFCKYEQVTRVNHFVVLMVEQVVQ